MAVAQVAQLFSILSKALQILWLVGQIAIAPGQVAIDGVTFDALADDIYRFQPHQFQFAHAVSTQ
ncbi:hypothetical protein D3C75_1170290 [compost metagenome]